MTETKVKVKDVGGKYQHFEGRLYLHHLHHLSKTQDDSSEYYQGLWKGLLDLVWAWNNVE